MTWSSSFGYRLAVAALTVGAIGSGIFAFMFLPYDVFGSLRIRLHPDSLAPPPQRTIFPDPRTSSTSPHLHQSASQAVPASGRRRHSSTTTASPTFAASTSSTIPSLFVDSNNPGSHPRDLTASKDFDSKSREEHSAALAGCFHVYRPENGTWSQSCSSIMKFGYPGTENIKFRKNYVLSYSFRHKQPNWVMEVLTSPPLHVHDGATTRSACTFVEDHDIPPQFAATDKDYRGSGFDRGHLAASFNHRTSQDEMCATFLLSNVSPQVGVGFNRHIWEQLETHARSSTKLYDEVYVCTGPLFLARMATNSKYVVSHQVIGDRQVAVPTHFFKVILGVKRNQSMEAQSFILPNERISNSMPLQDFMVSLEEVELASGLIFFNKVPRDEIIEIHRPIGAHRRPILEAA